MEVIGLKWLAINHKKHKHETTPFLFPPPFALPCFGTVPEQWQSKDNARRTDDCRRACVSGCGGN